MRKMMTALLVALMLPACALAENTIRIDGTIEAVKTQTITAPHSGMVGDFSVRAGDTLAAGDALFTLSAEKVYADFDGTVTGIFAEPGDSAASVQARYDALCYMERAELYTAQCSTSGGNNDNENKIIHVGETVYIQSTANKDRKGIARITAVNDRNYTIEVLKEKDMRLNEQIKVYREDDYDSEDCIGSGKLKRINPVAVTAEGYVRSVHVTEGQQVQRGDLLFEVVPDALEGMQGCDGTVTMPRDGVLLSVLAESGTEIAKDQPMATYCEKQDMQLVCPVDEEDLTYITVGMEVQVTLDAYRGQTITGTVLSIAGAGAEEGSSTSFDVTIALESSENVRVGMNATAEL